MDLPIVHQQTLRVRFCADALSAEDETLGALMETSSHRPRMLAFIDERVAAAFADTPERLEARCAQAGVELVRPMRRVIGGEAIKAEPSHVLPLLQQIAEAHIDRHSYVLAIGGGAVLDAVGFAAAVAHRGLRLIRMPTTTLAQADSGVGVKNGLNAFGQKNFIGTFAVPWAVVNSEHWLAGLSDRDWIAGFSEAVKVALVRDRELFACIAERTEAVRRRSPVARQIIRRSAELHAVHIASGGDPFELGSARPLDLGHWSAHRLEMMTSHRLRHGEAVAIGLALDTLYARRIGLLAADEAEAIVACLEALGLPIADAALADTDDLLAGLDDFAEHLGGRLTIMLPRRIGECVALHEIDRSAMRASIAELLDREPAAVLH